MQHMQGLPFRIKVYRCPSYATSVFPTIWVLNNVATGRGTVSGTIGLQLRNMGPDPDDAARLFRNRALGCRTVFGMSAGGTGMVMTAMRPNPDGSGRLIRISHLFLQPPHFSAEFSCAASLPGSVLRCRMRSRPTEGGMTWRREGCGVCIAEFRTWKKVGAEP